MSEILPTVIGVDLGASFTKVSLRPAWTEEVRKSSYREPSRMVVIDGSALIPTLMIYSARHDRWLAGQEAANYHPTVDDRVFANWKRSLYSSQLNHRVDGDMDAATQFFTWLGRRLREIDVGLNQCKIKICLPAFPEAEKSALLLLERMKRCGWAGRWHDMVSEPRANSVGVFGCGKNAANRFGDTGEVLPYYMESFPQWGLVIRHLRNSVLNSGPRYAKFMILDIGSFTADISVCTLDARRDGDCLKDVSQHSFELGLVDHYEGPLFAALLSSRALAENDLTFSDRERIKSALNEETLLQVAVPRRTSVTFGTRGDVDLSQKIAHRFADRLSETIQRFLGDSKPGYCVLTGGGMSIDALKGHLEADLAKMGIQPLPSYPGGPVGISDLPQETSIIDWENSGERLERLATALGASSVLLDLPTHEPDDEIVNVSPSPSKWVCCTCNGGNKECVKCGGFGMRQSVLA